MTMSHPICESHAVCTSAKQEDILVEGILGANGILGADGTPPTFQTIILHVMHLFVC